VLSRTKKECEQTEARVRAILARLGLELHPEKTRRAELYDGKEDFEFLGHYLQKRMSGMLWEQKGKRLFFLQRHPSQKSMKRIRSKVRELTLRSQCHEDSAAVIAKLNPVLRGWGNYFRTGNTSKPFDQLDEYL